MYKCIVFNYLSSLSNLILAFPVYVHHRKHAIFCRCNFIQTKLIERVRVFFFSHIPKCLFHTLLLLLFNKLSQVLTCVAWFINTFSCSSNSNVYLLISSSIWANDSWLAGFVVADWVVLFETHKKYEKSKSKKIITGNGQTTILTLLLKLVQPVGLHLML